MEPDNLIAQIRAAFAAVARPSPDNIVPCECGECDELRVGLLGFRSAELPDTWFEVDWALLPLLSDEAKHYYLAAYLCFALRHSDSFAAEFVLYSLDSDHRWQPQGGYSEAQRQAIRDFLVFQRCGLPDGDFLREEIERAEQRWRALA